MFSANSSQVSEDRLYVEDVFSTYLYTGNGSTGQSITNSVDLAGKGGLVWIKTRNYAFEHFLLDTARGSNSILHSEKTNAAAPFSNGSMSFLSNGFSLSGIGYDSGSNGDINGNGSTFASWTFRKAPKFFDVVTYTGTGSTQRIAHSLGVTPGVIIIKRTSDVAGWRVWHRSYSSPATDALDLNTTSAVYNGDVYWGNAGVGATPDATTFSVGTNASTNASGSTYVAYLFAHDTTSDGIIQCGSYTGNGSGTGPVINLGWEPQWVLVKNASAGTDWRMYDNMRGMPTGAEWQQLYPNLSDGEVPGQGFNLQSTGFQPTTSNAGVNASGNTYIYIAIRRGPMRTPTSGTSVFAPVARTGTGANATVSPGFVTDTVIEGNRTSTSAGTKFGFWDRLRGINYLISNTTAAEVAAATTIIQANPWDVMDGYKVGTTSTLTNASSNTFINWMFRRAPSFFDEVCYTGTGVSGTQNHNLRVRPDLAIIKNRGTTYDWTVFYYPSDTERYQLYLNSNDGWSGPVSSLLATSTTFGVGNTIVANAAGNTYVAYLFASCPGVSKVGTYTGNGSSQTINCGFAAGARFVMIKRTDDVGDWYVWDTARGIVAGNDPRLSLNSTAAEVTTDDSVDTDSSGFVVNQLSATNINVNAATYLYMAVA